MGDWDEQEQQELDEVFGGPTNPVTQEIVDEVDRGDAPLYTRNDLRRFCEWLRDNTDTFDDTTVSVVLDLAMNEKGYDGHALRPDDEMIDSWVRHFIETIGGEMATATIAVNVFFHGEALTLHPGDIVHIDWLSPNKDTAFTMVVTGARNVGNWGVMLMGVVQPTLKDIAVPLSQIKSITFNDKTYRDAQ